MEQDHDRTPLEGKLHRHVMYQDGRQGRWTKSNQEETHPTGLSDGMSDMRLFNVTRVEV